ncbi:hypothetical protein [Gottfriedia solisilvae]|uniref:Uncharacterized protein n=1 Tax=Gottfriedia solisilvae TaxID=1516104 RepID=A0A8J3F110_9BACI|nr:hypothetical protein [Gottfriedia solisilvae]GGI18470.1 hypothetical protein GCM10007380_43070 [Gottfriedia solisilvae]
MKTLSKVLFVLAFVCMLLGSYKLFVYDSGEYSDESKNAYVGGDAYNYIINAGQSTAYFVMTGVFSMLGLGFFYIARKEEQQHALLNEVKRIQYILEKQNHSTKS